MPSTEHVGGVSLLMESSQQPSVLGGVEIPGFTGLNSHCQTSVEAPSLQSPMLGVWGEGDVTITLPPWTHLTGTHGRRGVKCDLGMGTWFNNPTPFFVGCEALGKGLLLTRPQFPHL